MCTLAKLGMTLTKRDLYNELKCADFDGEYFHFLLFFSGVFCKYIFLYTYFNTYFVYVFICFSFYLKETKADLPSLQCSPITV